VVSGQAEMKPKKKIAMPRYLCHNCNNQQGALITTSESVTSCPVCGQGFIVEIPVVPQHVPHFINDLINGIQDDFEQGTDLLQPFLHTFGSHRPRQVPFQFPFPFSFAIPTSEDGQNLGSLEELQRRVISDLQTQAMEDAEVKLQPTSQEIIDRLPRTRLETDENNPSQKDCTICLEKNVGVIVKLPCEHEFHEECVVEWLKMQDTCPSCRMKVS
jgi:transcription elongation factor Elf1